MAATHDEGFHEIQLNGKQLVFLFMAATVVSVVIFLCGVLVGRGVRAERAAAGDTAPVTNVAETMPQQPAPAPAPPPAGSDPTAVASPPPAVDELSYFNRLERQKAQPEQLKPSGSRDKAADRSAPPAERRASPPPAPAPAPPPPAPAAAPAPAPEASAPPPPPPPVEPARPAAREPANAEPAGSGFAVQIAALNVRSEAEAIAKRLSAKGYAAYVLASGTPSVFRVRVGKFSTRREADSVASRLQREEQLKPWVTR